MMEIKKAKTVKAELCIGGKKKVCRVEVKPALMGRKCAACGSIFQMDGEGTGTWFARMSVVCNSNMLLLNCCSFECAEKLEAGGWWTPQADKDTTRECKELAKAGAVTEQVEFKIGRVKYEDKLVEEWEAMEELTVDNFEVEFGLRPVNARGIGEAAKRAGEAIKRAKDTLGL